MNALQPETGRLIARWQEAKQQLAVVQEQERSLRSLLLTSLFDPRKQEGTETIEVSHGFKLKAIKSMRYCFISQHHANETVLTLADRFGAEGQFTANRLVKWEPELIVSEYRKLSPAMHQAVAPHITISPATPQLALIVPKAIA